MAARVDGTVPEITLTLMSRYDSEVRAHIRLDPLRKQGKQGKQGR